MEQIFDSLDRLPDLPIPQMVPVEVVDPEGALKPPFFLTRSDKGAAEVFT